MNLPRRLATLLLALFLILEGCAPASPSTVISPTPPPNTPGLSPAPVSPSPVLTNTPSLPLPTPTPVDLGPEAAGFPSDYNPLTGQPVLDLPSMRLPAMLISISNFPAEARPQAGLSFADYVFEFSITEGATRFLSVFYADFPRPEVPVVGSCGVRMQPFVQTGEIVLGNRVWLDSDADGLQDFAEPGVGGVCVNLYDPHGRRLDQTTTDSNGFYGFNFAAPSSPSDPPYVIEFVQPASLRFTVFKSGNDAVDSDVDPPTGRLEARADRTNMDLDAGLVTIPGLAPTPDASLEPVPADVGPVRSGRLIYADFASMFQDSCLVYAFASEEVLEQIPACSMVVHETAHGGAMLEIERMHRIAEENWKADTQFNYASNRYTDLSPEGGLPGTQLDVFFARLNQSGWKYDPLMQSYLRFTDNSDPAAEGQLHADTDRLTSRQLHFENLIVLFTDHAVVSPTNLDIDLAQGGNGPAYLFRDGRAYPIQWSTRSGEYEKKTGFRRPIQWIHADGSPVPLKPGHTWVLIVTPFSSIKDLGAGEWKLRFFPPDGSS